MLPEGLKLAGIDRAIAVRIDPVEAAMQHRFLSVGRHRRKFPELRLTMLEPLALAGGEVRRGELLRDACLHALQLLQLLSLELIVADGLSGGRRRGLGRGCETRQQQGNGGGGDLKASG